MPRRTDVSKILIVSSAMALLTTALAAESKELTLFAHECGVDLSTAQKRIVADPNGKGWKQYRDTKRIPELELGFGEVAQVWSGRGASLVTTEAPGEDFTSYHQYCFTSNGQLVRLAYELRTAWGWGFRKTLSLKSDGSVGKQDSYFFDERNETRIPKPEQADDIKEALTPDIYTDFSKLPFARLFSVNKRPDARDRAKNWQLATDNWQLL